MLSEKILFHKQQKKKTNIDQKKRLKHIKNHYKLKRSICYQYNVSVDKDLKDIES